MTWDSKKLGHYYVDLQIRATGQQELLKEISTLFANAKIDLISFNSAANQRTNMVFITLTVQMNDLAQLKHIINQISQLPKVIDVKRARNA